MTSPTRAGTAQAPDTVAVLRQADRHLLNRFSYGVTPDLTSEVQDLGGARAWFAGQLDPESVPDAFATQLVDWFPRLTLPPDQLWATRPGPGLTDHPWCYAFQNWALLRRIYSRRQLLETMTELWSNLLHVPIPNNKTWTWRFDYDRTIRRHALGRFDELLEAADLHPAMLCYLDQAQSTAKAVNENFGRELLELHTVSRAAGFSEQEVRDSAHILTGWHVDMWKSWRLSYQPASHWVGPVRVLGFSAANGSPDGRKLSRRYLRYLAHHPVTARRIARKLAVRFVSDQPSRSLVNDLATVFSASGTDIKTTLRALVQHPEFLGSVGQKARTPMEDLAATYRAMQVEVLPPSGKKSDAAVNMIHLSFLMGQRPFEWQRPDGFPDVAEAWTSTARMLGSFRVHWNTAGGYSPSTGVRFKGPGYFFPQLPARFDSCIDHACRLLFARRAGSRMLQAVSQITGTPLTETISSSHPVVSYKFPRVLVALLDTPAHMKR